MNQQKAGNFLLAQAKKRKENLNKVKELKIFQIEKEEEKSVFEKALDKLEILEVVDEYDDMLEELYFARNAPHKFQYRNAKEIPAYQDFLKELFGKKPLWETGSWVYYPWTVKLIHFLPKDLHNEIRTSRNKNLITHKEQEKFRKFRVGIAGLSIGQSIAYTLAVNGGCETMHLADMDVIAATNTNRIRAGFDSIGLNKAIFVSRLIYEINPYAKLKLFTDGLIEENMDQFFSNIEAVVDEVDHLPTKLKIRQEAKKRGIPVLMASDVGDLVILEVERYDMDKKQALFNGKLDEEDIKLLEANSGMDIMSKIFIKLQGKENISQRLLDSTLLIGKKLGGPPQLGSTAFLSGISVAYALKKISCGERLNLSTIKVDLETHFITK